MAALLATNCVFDWSRGIITVFVVASLFLTMPLLFFLFFVLFSVRVSLSVCNTTGMLWV